MRLCLLLILSWLPFSAFPQAPLELRPVQVSPNVYAVIGDLGQQTFENEGINSGPRSGGRSVAARDQTRELAAGNPRYQRQRAKPSLAW